MQFLTEWISNIILLILLATILELLLPNSSLQRYVKMVVGLLLLVVILNPLFSIFSKDADSWVNSIGLSEQFQEIDIENSIENKKIEIERAQLAYISEQVAVQLKRQVEEEMITKFEKKIVDVNVTLNNFIEVEDPSDSITNVAINLSPYNTSLGASKNETIEAVALVSIDTTKRSEPAQQEESNKNEIIRYLSSEWHIPIEKIEVVMEGGRKQ